MKGIGAIVHSTGFAVSNEVIFDADKLLVMIDNQKHIKDVLTLKYFSIFDCEQVVTVGQEVECLFKSEEGVKRAFVGIVKSIKGSITTIHELKTSERYNLILTKIKK
jgi:hypothetical protein